MYMYRLIVVTKQKFQNGVVFCGQPPRTNQTAYMTFAVSLVKLPTEAVLNVFIYFTVIRFFPLIPRNVLGIFGCPILCIKAY